jgi:thioester reductase-like protein
MGGQPVNPSALSIHRAFAGKHILLTGASGFVGKVWLALVLQHVPTVAKIYVLLRKKALRPAIDRFEKIVANSPVFKPLHEQHGAGLAEFVARRVEVVEGDVSLPNLGVEDPEIAARLHRDVDLIFNCAGLVDFDPDLREAVSANIDGAVHVADFTLRCAHAKLLHVSTCYVTGLRNGYIAEVLTPNVAPNGQPFDVDSELAQLTRAIDEILAAHETPEAEQKAQDLAVRQIRQKGQDEHNAMLVRNIQRRIKRQRLKDDMIAEGLRRAKHWQWPNIYTYTKFMAEAIVIARVPAERRTIFRPAIVESAAEYPFPGWNQGFNTSGPLIYLTQGWFRHVPARDDNPFDVIPVDYVCKALTVASAALLEGRHAPVYQCGSSDLNLLTIGRAVELTALAHRKHLRRRGDSAVERVVLARWDAIVSEVDHLLSVRTVTESFSEWLRDNKWPKFLRSSVSDMVKNTDEALDTIDTIAKVVDLYQPFVHDNRFIFESKALQADPPVEPVFHCHPNTIDWRSYWIDTHVPGLRKWCFPLFENKTPESYTPRHPFKLPRPSAPAAEAPEARVAEGV